MQQNANVSKLDDIQNASDVSGKEKGIFTLYGIDVKRMYDIEDDRSVFVRNMEMLSDAERLEKMKSLLNDMQQFLESYQFDDYLSGRFINGYTFYSVIENINYTDGDLDFCRAAGLIGFRIWRECIRELGATVPTTRLHSQSTKEKIISRFMSLAGKVDVQALIDEYKTFQVRATNLNLFAFVLSKMYLFDLDANVMIVGKARSSKSTLAAWIFELIYGFRSVDIYENERFKKMLEHNYIFDNSVGMKALQTSKKGSVNWFDELYLTFDKRKSMNRKQVEATHYLNFFARNNCVNLFLIQNFIDADMRIKTKSSALVIVFERGQGLLFSDASFLPLFNTQFGLDEILENPNIGKERELALHMLRSRREYICDLTWNKRGAQEDSDGKIVENGDPFYAEVLRRKIMYQNAMVIGAK